MGRGQWGAGVGKLKLSVLFSFSNNGNKLFRCVFCLDVFCCVLFLPMMSMVLVCKYRLLINLLHSGSFDSPDIM